MSVARIPFTPADEDAIRMLAGTALFLTVMHFVVGALGLLGSCGGAIGVPTAFAFSALGGLASMGTAFCLLLWSAGMIAQAVLLIQLRTSLTAIVETDTGDQAHMADAFAKLKLFFLVEALLFAVGMGLTLFVSMSQVFGPQVPTALQGFGR